MLYFTLTEQDNENIFKEHVRDGPRKSLIFSSAVKNGKAKNEHELENRRSITQGFKRRIDEMYALLSDGDESDSDSLNDICSTDAPPILNLAKRARMSPSLEGNARATQNTSVSTDFRSANDSFRPVPQFRTCQVLTRPPVGKECISLTGSDGGRRVYLHVNKGDSLESNKVGILDFYIYLWAINPCGGCELKRVEMKNAVIVAIRNLLFSILFPDLLRGLFFVFRVVCKNFIDICCWPSAMINNLSLEMKFHVFLHKLHVVFFKKATGTLGLISFC